MKRFIVKIFSKIPDAKNSKLYFPIFVQSLYLVHWYLLLDY